MNALSRFARVPRQLMGSVRRNGVRKVLRFGAEVVVRHGPVETLRLALATPATRRARMAGEDAPPDERTAPSATDTDLDTGWSVSPKRWAQALAAQPLWPATASGVGAAKVHVRHDAKRAPSEAADEDWIVLLRSGDVAAPDLIQAVASAGADPHVEVITFDMVFGGEGSDRIQPVLQPGPNPWLARYADVGFGRYAFRAVLLRHGEAAPYERLQSWLAGLSLNEARDRWRHVFRPLIEAAMDLQEVQAARGDARARARARASLGAANAGGERVSVVICTHNRGRLVRQLVRALDDARIAEVVVVANNTTSPPAVETLDWVRSRPCCRVLIRDEPFNFSRLSNAGAALTTGERLLFLNDDVAPVSDDWLEPLLQPLRDPDVGVTGALLLYPNEAVQHAGMFLGFRGHAGHSLRHARLPEDDYLFYGSVPREVSAVTGAVMMVRRDLFGALNGFDELLPTYLQDVDLCLRARAVGLATVWTPLAELLHMESTTIREVDGPEFHARRLRERARFLHRWGELIARDPLRNPAFDVDDESQRTLAEH